MTWPRWRGLRPPDRIAIPFMAGDLQSRAARRRATLLSPVVMGLLLAGCSSGSGETRPTEAVSGEVTVFAAASLTESFAQLGRQFESAHPGVRVTFNFGPSSGLAAQVNAGASADVFASASTQNMDQVVSAGGATEVSTFARNVMQVVVPAANPGKVTTLADLARPGVTVAVCQPAVPCGVGAARVFASAKLTVTPVSQEADVKGVLTKVRLGEVDAGLVYVTDVATSAGSVRGIPIPAELNSSTAYPMTVTKRATNPAAAKAFVDYVLSSVGTAVLVANGFEKP